MLLIDDEREICLLLGAMLARFGARSVSAHSVAEARGSLAGGPYDGVFLDVDLPDGKGYELIPAIRECSPGSRVIVISALDLERDNAMEAGADLFLPKPLDRRSVLDGLRAMRLITPENEPE